MMSVFEAAWVIARRDFVATVYSRSFILFLIVPLLVFGVALSVGQIAEESERSASQPAVAVVTDGATAEALAAARERLAAGTPERSLPILRNVPPAENAGVQARRLLADEVEGYSAVFSGTLDRPVVTGPSKVDEQVTSRLQLIVETARRDAALAGADVDYRPAAIQRVVTEQAAGNLQMIRRNLAQTVMGGIFAITVLLATLLLSNLAEEKSNKVIEVLAAAVPLDSVFLGKLIAMLGISVVGLALWGGMAAIGYFFFQALQDWMTLPQAGPAVGWPLFILLVVTYYITDYLLLGALFLGIGAQASNIREIQTLSMPITMLQVLVFLLAMTATGSSSAALVWAAYIVPFSSPLMMVAYAAQQGALWPHLLALLWQALWIVLIIRISSRWFRMTALKSSPGGSFFSLAGWRRARTD